MWPRTPAIFCQLDSISSMTTFKIIGLVQTSWAIRNPWDGIMRNEGQTRYLLSCKLTTRTSIRLSQLKPYSRLQWNTEFHMSARLWYVLAVQASKVQSCSFDQIDFIDVLYKVLKVQLNSIHHTICNYASLEILEAIFKMNKVGKACQHAIRVWHIHFMQGHTR